MRLVVMFDIPNSSPSLRRQYGTFRRHLIAEGFSMEQLSVYSRPVATREACSALGTTPSNAIRMFVSAFNRRGGFPFDPSNPHGFSAETLQAMDDAVHHRAFGPFKTVDEMFAALDED